VANRPFNEACDQIPTAFSTKYAKHNRPGDNLVPAGSGQVQESLSG